MELSLDFWALRSLKLRVNETPTKHAVRQGVDCEAHRTRVCAKFQGLSPKNDVNIWVCVQKNMGILHVPGNDLVSVYDTIFWR